MKKLNKHLLATIVISLLLVSCGGDEPSGGGENSTTKLYQYVDLGLPSGTLWAVMNVGATKPEELGSLFAWGETSPKQVYEWGTYKWCKIDGFNLIKYCNNSSYGITDFKTELVPADDAAYVNWGSSWRMPRKEQVEELISYCTWQWTTLNGVNGFLVSSKNNDNSMFLPVAGDGPNEKYYWTRDLHASNPDKANCLFFITVYPLTYSEPYEHKQLFSAERYNGHCVRAVRATSN